MSDKTLKAALDTEVKNLKGLLADFNKPDSGAITVDGSTVHVDKKAYDAIVEAKARVSQIRDLLGAEDLAGDSEKYLAEPVGTKTARYGAVEEYKSVADILIESNEFKDMLDQRLPGMRGRVNLDVADIISRKDVYSAMAAYTPTYNIATNVQQLPTVPFAQIKPRVRDLFPAASTTANLLEYWRQDGLDNGGDGFAATVAERTNDNTNFGLKPKSDVSFSHASDPVRTIAHWIPAHRNTLSDAPQLRSLIDNSLLYGLSREEDKQLLNGDGAGENLLGLLNRPGIQEYVSPGGEWKADALRRSLTLAELAGFPATGIVLHPLDWEDIELQKGSTNDHYAITTNISVGAQQRVWRTPVVTTPHILEGSFLSAAFGQACQIYDREQANIRVAEQHADFFVRNAVVILAEERLGLTVQNPSAIVKGTFA